MFSKPLILPMKKLKTEGGEKERLLDILRPYYKLGTALSVSISHE